MSKEQSSEPSKEQRDSQLERTVALGEETHQRLQHRSLPDEHTSDEVITRLLDETAELVTLEEIVDRIQKEFDYIASIEVDHLVSHKNPTQLLFWAYTGEADGAEDARPLFDSNYLVAIERPEEQDIQLPFGIIASCGGPSQWDHLERTTIYMSDTVLGAEPIDLDSGLDYLKEKLARPDDWESSQDSIIDSVQFETET